MPSEKTYRVPWSEQAARDVEQIVTYIASDSPAGARRLLARLDKKTASLRVVPWRGRVIPEMARFGWREWRELIVKPYRIMYRIAGRSIHIAAVLDGRRDVEDLLLERLTRSAAKDQKRRRVALIRRAERGLSVFFSPASRRRDSKLYLMHSLGLAASPYEAKTMAHFGRT